jgi:hypothetical protein
VDDDPVLVDRSEAARRLNVSRRTVERYGKGGLLEERRVGPKLVMITEQSVSALIAGQPGGPGVKVTPGNAAIQGGASTSRGHLVAPRSRLRPAAAPSNGAAA